MKVFIVVASVLALAAADLQLLQYNPLLRTSAGLYATAAAVPNRIQYHDQDSLGQYRYGYSDGLSAKEEIKSFDGTTRGSYSYVDANGQLQTVDYVADALNGFRVAGTNLPKAPAVPAIEEQLLPKPVEDTNEVILARTAHLAAYNEAKTRSGETRPAEQIFEEKDLPKQVEDTREVAEAKIAHFAAKKEAELRNQAVEIVRAEQPILAAATPALPYSAIPALSALPAIRADSTIPYWQAAYTPNIAYGYNHPLAWNAARFVHQQPILY